MEHSEMIEKLHNQAGISESDAEDALRRAGWDILDALQILEREGKIAPLTSSMTTVENSGRYEEVKATASRGKKIGGDFWGRFFTRIKEILYAACVNTFVIRRKGEIILNIPVLITAIILFCTFQVSIVALIAGMFFECSYSVEKNVKNNRENSESSDGEIK